MIVDLRGGGGRWRRKWWGSSGIKHHYCDQTSTYLDLEWCQVILVIASYNWVIIIHIWHTITGEFISLVNDIDCLLIKHKTILITIITVLITSWHFSNDSIGYLFLFNILFKFLFSNSDSCCGINLINPTPPPLPQPCSITCGCVTMANDIDFVLE